MSGIEVRVLTLCSHINHQMQYEVKANTFVWSLPEMEVDSRGETQL